VQHRISAAIVCLASIALAICECVKVSNVVSWWLAKRHVDVGQCHFELGSAGWKILCMVL